MRRYRYIPSLRIPAMQQQKKKLRRSRQELTKNFIDSTSNIRKQIHRTQVLNFKLANMTIKYLMSRVNRQQTIQVFVYVPQSLTW